MQDKAIVEIGRLKGDKKPELYQNFIENPFPGQNFNVILILFNISKQNGETICSFKGVDIEKASEKNYQQYAYRKGSPRGGDITFTTKFFGNIEKKFKTLLAQANKATSIAQKINEGEERQILKSLKKCLEEKATQIKTQLNALYESLDKKQQASSLLSFKFQGIDLKKYLIDFKTFQYILLQAGTSGKAEKYQVVSKGEDALCSICHEKKELVYGFASPYKYASVDKPGFVSGFFRQKNNWKNYPICTDCALEFELGKKYIAEKLNRHFYGKRYFIIPQTTIPSQAILDRALIILENVEYKEREGSKIESREENLMRKIAIEEGSKNQFTISLLFYEEDPKTKAMKIKLFIEELFPSRFREIFIDIPRQIELRPVFKNAIQTKKEKYDLKFSFQILKFFFEDSFYKVTQSVFLGTHLSEKFIYAGIMRQIRKEAIASKRIRTTILKGLMVLSYFQKLHLITKGKKFFKMEHTQQNSEFPQEGKGQNPFDLKKFNEFINANSDFFGSHSECSIGIFAVGVLVRQVFNWQKRHLDNTPFEKKLKGYRLNAKDLKKIYCEALDKLNKYSSFYTYQPLRKFLANTFVLKAPEMEQMSNNEISFYFVAGLEFGNNFKTSKTSKDD